MHAISDESFQYLKTVVLIMGRTLISLFKTLALETVTGRARFHDIPYLHDMSAIENDYIIAWSPTNSICLTFLNVDTLLQHKMIASLETHHNEYTTYRFL